MTDDSRLEARIRLALMPTEAETNRMRAGLQQSIREETAWRVFTTIMVQSRRNLQACLAHSQAAAVSAVHYHQLGA